MNQKRHCEKLLKAHKTSKKIARTLFELVIVMLILTSHFQVFGRSPFSFIDIKFRIFGKPGVLPHSRSQKADAGRSAIKISNSGKYWTAATFILIVIIITGSILTWSRYSKGQPIEISAVTSHVLSGKIYVDGAVNNPGFYPLNAGDTLEDILEAAGGTASNAALEQLKLYIPEHGTDSQTQKVNLNRAEAWLLMALPGIGETRASAIIDYHQRNGPFRNIYELNDVEGIGMETYEKIKQLVTVAD